MKIAVMPGDGIGKEVTAQAVKVLRAVLGSHTSLELVEATPDRLADRALDPEDYRFGFRFMGGL